MIMEVSVGVTGLTVKVAVPVVAPTVAVIVEVHCEITDCA
jgi:hypothetical protein